MAYFPITFRPPPNDPHGVTREELVRQRGAVLSPRGSRTEALLKRNMRTLQKNKTCFRVRRVLSPEGTCFYLNGHYLRRQVNGLQSCFEAPPLRESIFPLLLEGVRRPRGIPR